MANMTRLNPDGVTYRVPMGAAGELRIFATGDTQAVFGDMVNRLGRYEKLGEPEEVERKLAAIKK